MNVSLSNFTSTQYISDAKLMDIGLWLHLHALGICMPFVSQEPPEMASASTKPTNTPAGIQTVDTRFCCITIHPIQHALYVHAYPMA